MGEARRKKLVQLAAKTERNEISETLPHGAAHYPYSPDTGVARLDLNDIPISEETRDRLRKFDDTAPRRPLATAPENKTAKELQEERWSGLRKNEITRQTEIWVLGNIHKTLPTDKLATSPQLLAEAFEEVFKTNGSVIEIDMPENPALVKDEKSFYDQFMNHR